MIIPIKTSFKIYEYKNRFYMRTRDVATILEIAQPFEFNANIKKEFMDNNIILKGEKTVGFRDKLDTSRTTFIELQDLILFLECGNIKHKLNKERKKYLLTYVKNLI